MKIFITGISGLIGRALCHRLISLGHQVAGFSRNPEQALVKLASDAGPNVSLPELQIVSCYDSLQNFCPEVVINLAGEPIADKRWSDQRKKVLRASRVEVTLGLVEWMSQLSAPPTLFISGSAIGYYGDQGSRWVSESSDPHDEFASRLCREWEQAAMSATAKSSLGACRVCTIRTGVVIAKGGGFLKKLSLPFSLGLGGRLGNGEQYLSWVHLSDVVAAIECLITRNDLAGAFNLTAPVPVTNEEFTRTFSKILSRPAFLHMPEIVLKRLLGELSQILLTGQRVAPQRLSESGFQFRFEHLKDALKDVLN